MNRISHYSILGFLLMIWVLDFSGCGEEGTAGPCVHIYREPIFHVTSVTETGTQAKIGEIVIREVRINGLEYPPSLLNAESENVVFQDSLLICTVPFSFGHTPGDWQFEATASGYVEATFNFPGVQYSEGQGGCPSYSDGGVRVTLELDPE
jgi:hypothetical protein